MKKTAHILCLDPKGPNGLEEWEQMDYASLVSGEPVQHGHLYHAIADKGYMVGVWDCSAFTDKMMQYTVDEYMFLLEGDLTMALPDGQEIKVQAGDAFVIPKGFVCQWKQHSYVKKYFMIVDASVPEAKNISLQRITLPDLSQSKDTVNLSSSQTEFLNAEGTMWVEIQSFGAMSRPFMKVSENRLISVCDGSLTLGDGVETFNFIEGDTVYLRQDDKVSFETTESTQLLVASFYNPAKVKFG